MRVWIDVERMLFQPAPRTERVIEDAGTLPESRTSRLQIKVHASFYLRGNAPNDGRKIR